MTCTMRVWHKTRRPRSSRTAALAALGHQGSTSLQQSPYESIAHARPKSSLISSGAASAAEAAATNGTAASSIGREFDDASAGPELILTPMIPARFLVEQQHNLCCTDSFGETPRLLSQRFPSVGSGSFEAPVRRYSLSTSHQTTTKRIGNTTIALKDILLIDVHGNSSSAFHQKDSSALSPSDQNLSDTKKANTHCIHIVTISNGIYEFAMESANGRELLLAFLKANLPRERINDQDIHRTPSNVTNNTSHSNRSFDVEAFTAKRMSERLKSESIGEKLQRRVHRLVSSFEECKFFYILFSRCLDSSEDDNCLLLFGFGFIDESPIIYAVPFLHLSNYTCSNSGFVSFTIFGCIGSVSCAMTECATCGCGHAAVSPAPPHDLMVTDAEKANAKLSSSFPPNQQRQHAVEMAPSETPRTSRPSVVFRDRPMENYQPDRVDILRNSQIPSGLSVESDSEME